MIPATFDYFAPGSLDEAIQLLQQHGDEAKILAGGHSLIPLMKLRLAEPRVLIDIGQLADLSYVRTANGSVAVGALTTYHTLETSAVLKSDLPLLSEAAASVGDIQVRNRGTIGGSLVHADPGGDLPAVVVALEAEFVVRGPGGERTISAGEFFVGMLTTSIAPNEVLTEIRLPKLSGKAGYAYQKAANQASGYAIVGVAAAVSIGDGGNVQDVRIGITGAGAQAVRATAAENALKGQRATPETIRAAADQAASAIDDPLEDIHASGAYRKELVKVHTRRALERAVRAAGG